MLAHVLTHSCIDLAVANTFAIYFLVITINPVFFLGGEFLQLMVDFEVLSRVRTSLEFGIRQCWVVMGTTLAVVSSTNTARHLDVSGADLTVKDNKQCY